MKSELKVVICYTCGGARLAMVDGENVDVAKRAIWDMPRHRGHYLDVVNEVGEVFRLEVEKAENHVYIFPHVLHPPKRRDK